MLVEDISSIYCTSLTQKHLRTVFALSWMPLLETIFDNVKTARLS